jgi:hypothetical protein
MQYKSQSHRRERPRCEGTLIVGGNRGVIIGCNSAFQLRTKSVGRELLNIFYGLGVDASLRSQGITGQKRDAADLFGTKDDVGNRLAAHIARCAVVHAIVGTEERSCIWVLSANAIAEAHVAEAVILALDDKISIARTAF